MSQTRRLNEEQLAQLLSEESELEFSDEDSEVSEYELDDSSNEEGSDQSAEEPEPENIPPDIQLLSKVGKIVWSLDKPDITSSRIRAENVLKLQPGPSHYAVGRTQDILSSFELCFNLSMREMVLKYTNLEGCRVYGVNWKNIDMITLEAYIGILLLAGVYRSKNGNLHSLWDGKRGRPIFIAVMPLKTFKQISRLLRFDDRTERQTGESRDKLAPIRTLWDKWVTNCRLIYNPSENITIEQLVRFRGRYSFRQYIPSKPGKYGMKIWTLCCSKTKFCWNMQVYLGRARNTRAEINQSQRVVLDLVQGLHGHNVTCDNFFSSYELAMELKRDA